MVSDTLNDEQRLIAQAQRDDLRAYEALVQSHEIIRRDFPDLSGIT